MIKRDSTVFLLLVSGCVQYVQFGTCIAEADETMIASSLPQY